MANPKGNPQTLKPYKPKWKSGKTQTIRVPIAIAHLVLEAAREIDENGNVSLLQVIKELKEETKQSKKAQSSLSTDTSETTQGLITDKELAKILECDRSNLGKVRRKLLKGEPSKSKLLDRLAEYEPLPNGWRGK